VQAADKASIVSNSATKYAVSNVLTYISMFVEGFRRWRGYILTPKRNPDIQGSCSLANHCSLLARSEQNSSKLQHAARDIYRRPVLRKMEEEANLTVSLA
jgi:hypothetical protein